MPEDSKKNQQKGKNEPKEQRKPRRSGHQQKDARHEKMERKEQAAPKVIVPQPPPVYESPGPEFYQGLKRETDEILKITEEENSKYKKKEIKSNWAKYEMPIESYDDIEEQENMGADYEKLIQAPLSAGGHFQFKHEKSWDISTGPSLYDKYFDINMDDLSVALSTIPFYERNDIDQTLFSQTDILTMNNRSTRFKQKYYNDKSYSTPEDTVLDIITKKLGIREGVSQESASNNDEEVPADDNKVQNEEINLENSGEKLTHENTSVTETHDDKLGIKSIPNAEEAANPAKINKQIINTNNARIETNTTIDNNLYDLDDIILEKKSEEIKEDKNIEPVAVSNAAPKVVSSPPLEEPKKNPIIESPEDLEKWLDDFLDG